jgi:putative hydrolase of HD superfamily
LSEAIEGILEFLKKAGKLKGLQRTGWLESGVDDPESVAEHMFRTALATMLLSDLKGYDTCKAVRMALLHDLIEVEIGDLTPTQKAELEGLNTEEDKAMKFLLSGLPKEISEAYLISWKELRDEVSTEARLVANVDRLEMLLQAFEYEERGVDPYRLDHFWEIEIKEGAASEFAKALSRKRDST